MDDVINGMCDQEVAVHLEQLVSEQRFDELAQAVARLSIADERQPYRSLQGVLGETRSVAVVQACLDAGADPNPTDNIPPFYSVPSEEAAAYLEPLTKLLDHDGRKRLLRSLDLGTDMLGNPVDDEQVDQAFLIHTGNALAVRQIASSQKPGHPCAIQSYKDWIFDAKSVGHARAYVELGADPFKIFEGGETTLVRFLSHQLFADRHQLKHVVPSDCSGVAPVEREVVFGAVVAVVAAGKEVFLVHLAAQDHLLDDSGTGPDLAHVVDLNNTLFV